MTILPPPDHNLCGPIEYSVIYDVGVTDTPVTDSTRPLSYEEDSVDKTFKVETSNPDLVGTTADYSLTA